MTKSDYVVIETPEKVKIRYKIASPLTRLTAFLFDYAILILFLLSFYFMIRYFFMSQLEKLWAETGEILIKLSVSLVRAFFIILYFILIWWYFVILEFVFNGKTFGKLILKIRVINYEGKHLDFPACVLRNFLRIVDFSPVTFYLGGVICTIINKDLRRIGDLVANTIVIKEEGLSQKLPDFNVASSEQTAESARHLIYKLSEKELYLVRRFLKSMQQFQPDKREEIAGKLALKFSQKLNDQSEINDPIGYLEQLYQRHKNL